MKKIIGIGVTVLLAVMALVGCPGTITGELSNNTVLASVTVAGKTVTLGIPSSNWMDAKEDANLGVVFLTSAQMQNAAVVVNKGDSKQTIFLAVAKPSVMPDFGTDTQLTFAPSDFLWIEVFSENHTYTLYAIQVRTSTPIMLDLTLGGRSAVGGVRPNGQIIKQYGTGLGTHNADFASVVEGEIWFGDIEANTLMPVTFTPEDPDTIVLVASGTGAAAAGNLFPPDYTNPADIQAVNGNYLYIKATSADPVEGETIYYKVKMVSKTVDYAIDNVTIQASNLTPVDFSVGPVGTLGFGGGERHFKGAMLHGQTPTTSQSSYPVETDSPGGFKSLTTTYAPAYNVTVVIGIKPDTAKIRYGHTDFYHAQEGVPPSTGGGTITLVYQTNNVLQNVTTCEYIAVELENELTDKYCYAFRVRWGDDSAALTDISSDSETVSVPDANTAVNGTNREKVSLTGAGPWNVRIEATAASNGADVGYAKAAAVDTALTAAAFAGGASFTESFTGGQFAVIRVISQSRGVTNYYKLQFVQSGGDNSNTLSNLTISDGTATSSDLSGDIMPNLIIAGSEHITHNMGRAGPYASITVAATDGSSTISYGTTTSATGNPANWNTTGLFSNVAQNAFVVIRVVSQDLSETNFYKVRLVNGSSDTTLTSFRINNADIIPLPAAQTAVNIWAPGSYETKNMGSAGPWAGVNVVAAAAANTAVAYAIITDIYYQPEAYQTGAAGEFNAVKNNAIVVRVTAQDGVSIRYYKVQLMP